MDQLKQKAEKATILIVDDERGPRESLRMILAPTYNVIQAENGARALEILRTERVELVTLDLNMPGMKGEDVMRTIRGDFPDVQIIVITGCGTVESAADGIRFGISDYLQKPFDVVQVTASVTRALKRQEARLRLTGFLGELGQVVGHNKDAEIIMNDVQRSEKLRGRLGHLFEDGATSGAKAVDPQLDFSQTIEFLEVLAETIETKDRFMRGHARRVAFYSDLLAHRLKLSEEDHEHVRLAAFLHDLGKVGVPTDLLLRPSALDPSERAVVEQHPEIGARLIKPLHIPATVSAAILHHHEWWDGTGYPAGLSGEETPLAARIIGVADAFDAMSSDRPYRRALDREVVISEIGRFAGVQFDPDIAKEFVAILETGVYEVDPELLADAVQDSSSGPRLPAMPEVNV